MDFALTRRGAGVRRRGARVPARSSARAVPARRDGRGLRLRRELERLHPRARRAGLDQPCAGRAAFGGAERPMFFKLVLLEELALAGAPFGPLAGIWQTADAIIEYGSERLRAEVLPAIARGEASFWQGYSEPDAGSDLLALKTEARRDGDHYVIRGHKIWSSHAGDRDARARVRAHEPRGAAQPRASACSSCRTARRAWTSGRSRASPARSTTTRCSSTTCACPEGLRLGPEGEGFVALLNGLDSDRFWGRFYKAPALQRVLARLVAARERRRWSTARRSRAIRSCGGGSPRSRPSIAALRWLFYRAGVPLRDGAPITYETAVAKVLADETGQKLARARHGPARAVGPAPRRARREAKLDGEISHAYLTSLGHTIAGGTAEILRTTVADARPRPAEPCGMDVKVSRVMDFRPSPAQQLLIATAREYLRRHCPIELAQRLALDRASSATRPRALARHGGARLAGLARPGRSRRQRRLAARRRSCSSRRWATRALPGPFVASAVVATIARARRRERGAAQARAARAGDAAIASRRWRSSRTRGSFDPDALTLHADRCAAHRAQALREGRARRGRPRRRRCATAPARCSLPADRRGHRAAAARHDERREALRGHVRRRRGARGRPARDRPRRRSPRRCGRARSRAPRRWSAPRSGSSS